MTRNGKRKARAARSAVARPRDNATTLMKSPDNIASQMDQGNVVTATSEQSLKLVHAEYSLRKDRGQEAPSYRLSNDCFRRDPILESSQTHGTIFFRCAKGKTIAIERALLASVAPNLSNAIVSCMCTAAGCYTHTFEVDFTAIDFETFDQYSDYLQGAVPVDITFAPAGLSFKQKMRLVQLSAIGAILGNGRFEKAANEAIWHDFIDREAPWTVSELMRVLEITPVDCALRPLLFLEYYKVYTNGGGSIAASFEETMIDPYGSLFMDQLSRLIEEGFERHDLVKMASQQRNEYLRTKASNKFTKDSFLKLPLEVTPIKTLSRDTRKPSFTYMGGRTYTTGGPNDGTSVVTNRPGHMIKNKQSLEIAEDDRAAKRQKIDHPAQPIFPQLEIYASAHVEQEGAGVLALAGGPEDPTTKVLDTKHLKKAYIEVMAVVTKIGHRFLNSSKYGPNIKHDSKDTDLSENWESMDMTAKLELNDHLSTLVSIIGDFKDELETQIANEFDKE